jgi:hypothetical protein
MAKVDLDIAYVAMTILQVYVKCFIYFRRMLHLFQLDVAKVKLDLFFSNKSGPRFCRAQNERNGLLDLKPVQAHPI